LIARHVITAPIEVRLARRCPYFHCRLRARNAYRIATAPSFVFAISVNEDSARSHDIFRLAPRKVSFVDSDKYADAALGRINRQHFAPHLIQCRMDNLGVTLFVITEELEGKALSGRVERREKSRGVCLVVAQRNMKGGVDHLMQPARGYPLAARPLAIAFEAPVTA
jgi:hypothetical protein